MKITVVGGGNIGTQFAVHIAEKGHEVTMFTSNPGVFRKHLSIVDTKGNAIHEGDIHLATNDPHRAFNGADVIMITMPPTMMIPLAKLIYENTGGDTVIGFVPGNGGFELAFRKCIERGNTFFGIDRVPAIARLTERGYVISERAFYNAEPPDEMTQAISKEESLRGLTTPSVKAEAASVKGRGLGGLRKGRNQWSECTARHIERRARWREFIERRINTYREKTSGEESGDSNALAPDLHSRYFTADFPYGLSVIQQIGIIAGVDIPNINGLLDWYDEIAIVNDKLIISDFGIFDMNTLKEFYLQ